MITFKQTGNFNNTEQFLNRASKLDFQRILQKYATAGVNALASATPVDSGLTADSWGYEIKTSGSSCSILFTNSHVVDGVPIAIIIQYGHGTRNGGYVQGRDYINPAIQPLFDKIAEDAWREVTKT